MLFGILMLNTAERRRVESISHFGFVYTFVHLLVWSSKNNTAHMLSRLSDIAIYHVSKDSSNVSGFWLLTLVSIQLTYTSISHSHPLPYPFPIVSNSITFSNEFPFSDFEPINFSDSLLHAPKPNQRYSILIEMCHTNAFKTIIEWNNSPLDATRLHNKSYKL